MSGTTMEEYFEKWNTYDDDGFRKERMNTIAWIRFRDRLNDLVKMEVYNIEVISGSKRVPIEYCLYEHCFLLEDEWESFLEQVRKYLQDSYEINVRISDEYPHHHSMLYHKHKECYVELIPKNGFLPTENKLW